MFAARERGSITLSTRRSPASRTACASRRSRGEEPRSPTPPAVTISPRSDCSPRWACSSRSCCGSGRTRSSGRSRAPTRRCRHRGAAPGWRAARSDPPRARLSAAQSGGRGRGQGRALLRSRSPAARAAHRCADRARGCAVRIAQRRDPPRPAATTLLALVAVLPAAGLTLNQFGLDGAALWSNVAAGNDPRADLTGKNLASMLVMVPLATVAAFVTAAFTQRVGVSAAHARSRARHLRRTARSR